MTILELAELMDQSASECAEEAKETRSWPDQDEALTMHADRLDWHVKKYRATAAALRELHELRIARTYDKTPEHIDEKLASFRRSSDRLLQEIKS